MGIEDTSGAVSVVGCFFPGSSFLELFAGMVLEVFAAIGSSLGGLFASFVDLESSSFLRSYI